MSNGGRDLTLQQVANWRDYWSWDDQSDVVNNIMNMHAVSFATIPCGDYVKCFDADGVVVMNIGAGWYQTLRQIIPGQPSTPKWDWYALSVFGSHDGGEQIPELRGGICQIHHIERSLDGTCDRCDDY